MLPVISLKLLSMLTIQMLIPRKRDRETIAQLIPWPLRVLLLEAEFFQPTHRILQTVRQIQRSLVWPSVLGGQCVGHHFGAFSPYFHCFHLFVCIENVMQFETLKKRLATKISKNEIGTTPPLFIKVKTRQSWTESFRSLCISNYHNPNVYPIEIHFKMCHQLPSNILSLIHEISSLFYFDEEKYFALSIPGGFVAWSERKMAQLGHTFKEQILLPLRLKDSIICQRVIRDGSYSFEYFQFVCETETSSNSFCQQFCTHLQQKQRNGDLIAPNTIFYFITTMQHMHRNLRPCHRQKCSDVLFQIVS